MSPQDFRIWPSLDCCCCSVAMSCLPLCDPMDYKTPLSFTTSRSLFMSIESVMLSKHLILCWPFFLLPSILPCIRVFPSESSLCIRWPKYWSFTFSNSPSVQFSHSVVSDSLWPHESQHARPPCLSPTPGVYSNSCPSSRWCHPAISSSVFPFSSCPQSLPASGSFPMSQLFTWDGQSTGVSASASVLPMNTQDWSSLGWTGWISLQSKGLSRVFSNITVQKHQFFGAQLSSQSNSHIHTWPLEKHSLDQMDLCRQSNVSAF